MGKKPRLKQERLGGKLLQIRNTLGLSQTEMWRRLGVEDAIPQKQISKYELGISEPPLLVVLLYARAAGVNMEALVDDKLDLPERLPDTTNHREIERRYARRGGRK